MADVLVSDALTQVRQYLGDDHPADRGAVPASALLGFMQREYDQVYEKCAKDGVITTAEAPSAVAPLTWSDDNPGPVDLPQNVMAVCDVFYYDGTSGGSYRYLRPAQPNEGKMPFGQERGPAVKFAVYGASSSGAKVQLWPYPGLTSSYYVTYIPSSMKLVLTSPTPLIETDQLTGIPSAGVDRVVLGTYRRALLSRRESSPQLNDLIRAADMDLGFYLATRIQGASPKVRNTDNRNRGWFMRGQDSYTEPNKTTDWIWLH